MLRQLILLALPFSLLAFQTKAFAGATSTQIAGILLVEDGNLVYVYPKGGVASPPACHGSNGNYYSFSMSRPRAKEYLAALLTAQTRGATVLLVGTGTCKDQSVSETLSYFVVY
jgi:hypothetical protein